MRTPASISRTSLRGVFFRASLRVMGAAHKLLYRATGGRVATRIWGLSVLLLTTRGRKTGRPRTTPLCFLRDGDDFVVVASNGGMDWFPSWWLNLLREPQATIQIGRTRRPIRARQATPEERDRLWTQLTSIAPGYLRYEARTSRPIPVGILQPADSSFATGSSSVDHNLSVDVPPTTWGSRIASRASRLRRAHRGGSIFVDLDDVTSGIWAAREALETLRSPQNDRVCFGAGLDQVPLFDLLVKERVEAFRRVPPGSISPMDRSFASEADVRVRNPHPSTVHFHDGSTGDDLTAADPPALHGRATRGSDGGSPGPVFGNVTRRRVGLWSKREKHDEPPEAILRSSPQEGTRTRRG